MNYYNDFDKGAAAWLRELIKAGLIPNGYVDERSITEVIPADLAGFTQCHFFCGIGGWPFALQLAGVPATVPLWTGSPPCQPFSVAGKQLGSSDPRHLAPAFLELIAQCRPAILFGEQVAAAIGKHWLDALLIELEEQGYTCGTAVLPAASVGAPHKRDRLFFGAIQLADNNSRGCWQGRESGSMDAVPQHRPDDMLSIEKRNTYCGMADVNDARPQGRGGVPECSDQQSAGASGMAGVMADAGNRAGQPCESWPVERGLPTGVEEDAAIRPNPHHGFWSGADWLGCRDGKFRPVRSGTFPLANGISARVGRLRGYGNAIVPQCAAEFIKAFTGAFNHATEAGASQGATNDA